MLILRFTVARLLYTIPVLFGVTVIVFVSVHLVPGDVARTLLGYQASNDAVEVLRKQLGLDQPVLIQYGRWLWSILQGDLGMSIAQRVPVAGILGGKIVNSLILMGASLALVIPVSLMLTTLSASRFRSVTDRVIVVVLLILASLPVFWLGIILAYVFAVRLDLFPFSGMYNMADPGGILQRLHYLVLPAVTTAAGSVAVVTRVSRSALIDVLGMPYILAVKSRGLPRRRVIYVHGVRNMLPTFANMVGLQIGYLFGSVIFTEIVFSWPGVGLQLYNSILQRDAPVIQGCALAVAVVFVIGNLISDVIVRMLDATQR